MTTHVLAYLLPLCLVLAAVYDVTTTKIPNWISGVLIVAFFVITPFLDVGFAHIGMQVGISICALLTGFLLFSYGAFGGGDAKLIAASLLWFNPASIIPFLIYMAITGGLIGFAFMALKYIPLPLAVMEHPWGEKLTSKKPQMPYGVAIAVGGLLAYPETDIFAALMSL